MWVYICTETSEESGRRSERDRGGAGEAGIQILRRTGSGSLHKGYLAPFRTCFICQNILICSSESNYRHHHSTFGLSTTCDTEPRTRVRKKKYNMSHRTTHKSARERVLCTSRYACVRACVRACTCAWDTHACIHKAVTSSHAHTH